MSILNIGLGLDIDLNEVIEKLRGKTSCATFINNTLKLVLINNLPANVSLVGD